MIVSEEMRAVCPQFVGACVCADVENSPMSEPLWTLMESKSAEFASQLTTESIKSLPPICATREIYRLCGKDPSRYRPAAEALLRRVIQGKSLYQVNTLVDLINLASMVSGYSIGGFDSDKFHGTTLTLGIGRENEPYEGIGRGLINIHRLPVYRDSMGGVGTPTSDNERTKIEPTTTHTLILVNGYDGNEKGVGDTAEYMISLLRDFCNAANARYSIYR